MAGFHNWTGDEEIDKQVPQFLNEDNAATKERLDTKFNKSLDIANASDLNNFMDEGFYCCNTNSCAETILNCPTNYAFGLMVWGKGTIVYQEVREYNRSSKNQEYNNCWRRSYYSGEDVQGTWSKWQQMSYSATTLAGYGITDGMSKSAINSVSVADIMKRNINTSYLRLTGGNTFDKDATLQLCGGTYATNAGQFLLKAADSTHSAVLSGNPSGLLKWNDKNIVRSVNNSAADDDGNVTIDVNSVIVDTELSGTSTNPVQNKTIKNEFDKLLLPDGMLTIPSSSKSYISKVASDSLTLINNLTQTVIEQSADGETWETLFDSDTANETIKTLYKNGLDLSPFIDVAKGKMVRVTLSTHTTLYFASIALGMKIMDESNPDASNPYKCYVGMNSLSADPVATGTIATWGSTPCTVFRVLSNNTVRYVFNEDKKDLTIYFSGIYCKGSKANRTALRYDSGNKRTVTDFPIAAPSFLGTATKATQDGDGNVISTTYAKKTDANTWEEQQDFKEVKLGYEKYLSRKISNTGSRPAVSLMQYEATGAFTLDLSRLSTGLQINESTVFTAYITSSAGYPLTITNAGTIKYIGSASDVAITSAGLLLNILMMRDANDTVTSIVQASRLEGGA